VPEEEVLCEARNGATLHWAHLRNSFSGVLDIHFAASRYNAARMLSAPADTTALFGLSTRGNVPRLTQEIADFSPPEKDGSTRPKIEKT